MRNIGFTQHWSNFKNITGKYLNIWVVEKDVTINVSEEGERIHFPFKIGCHQLISFEYRVRTHLISLLNVFNLQIGLFLFQAFGTQYLLGNWNSTAFNEHVMKQIGRTKPI